MNRYQTKFYLTTDESKVTRLAAIDKTPLDQIKVARDVEPLHVAAGWVYWSDGVFTPSAGLSLPLGGTIAPVAEQLISAVWGADGGTVVGGFGQLTDLLELLEEKTIAKVIFSQERYQPPEIVWSVYRTKDGGERSFYKYLKGYSEGYLLLIAPTLEELKAEDPCVTQLLRDSRTQRETGETWYNSWIGATPI